MKLSSVVHTIAASLILLFSPVAAVADVDVPNSGLPLGESPLRVDIGFSLVNITDVGEKEETLEFEGAMYLAWQDSRLAYDPAEYGMSASWVPGDYSRAPAQIYQGDFAVKEVYDGWRPHLVIPNAVGSRVVSNMTVRVWPDGRVAYSESFYVRAETPMDLRRFPFDTQQLEIFFHPSVYHRGEVVLVPDNSLARTWEQNMGIADWTRLSVTMEERPTSISFFDDKVVDVSEFVVTVTIKRRPMHMIISILFPMVVLVSLTWCVFWMEDETLVNRVSITFIGILSVVTYYFVILENVPEVSYLTLIDALVIATFMILAGGVVLGVIMENIVHENRKELASRVDRVCRWAFPLAYLLSTFALGLIFLGGS